MVHARGVERRGAALDAVDGVALCEQQFGELGAVLTRNAGNQRNFPADPAILAMLPATSLDD